MEQIVPKKEKENIQNLYQEDNLAEKKFDVKLEHMNQLLDRPLSWVPKFDIDIDDFMKETKNGKFTRYYKKLQYDYYSEF